MFARVLGPYLVIVTVTVARASDVRTLVSEFHANSVWPWVTGAFVLLSGRLVIALHQNWRGAAAIIVSLLGWSPTLKGFSLEVFPDAYISLANNAIDAVLWVALDPGIKTLRRTTESGCSSFVYGPSRISNDDPSKRAPIPDRRRRIGRDRERRPEDIRVGAGSVNNRRPNGVRN